MNADAVKRICRAYLEQASNQLVSLEVLHRRACDDPECGSVSEQELLECLRQDESFRVIEPLRPAAMGDPKDIKAIGFTPCPRVILASRVPKPAELFAMIRAELQNLTDALSKALGEAQRTGNADVARQVIKILDRANVIKERAGDLDSS